MSVREEKKAFKRLCDADVGPGHEHRILEKSYQQNLDCYVEYKAYISNFGSAPGATWFGWEFDRDLNIAVDKCIENARKETA